MSTAEYTLAKDIITALSQLPNLKKLMISLELFDWTGILKPGDFQSLKVICIAPQHSPFGYINPWIERKDLYTSCFPVLSHICLSGGMRSLEGLDRRDLRMDSEGMTFIHNYLARGQIASNDEHEYYRTILDYHDHMYSLFRRYPEGIALSWDESGRRYNRVKGSHSLSAGPRHWIRFNNLNDVYDLKKKYLSSTDYYSLIKQNKTYYYRAIWRSQRGRLLQSPSSPQAAPQSG